MLDFIKNISPIEFAVIALILIVIFGRKAVTNLGRTGGETLREIKKITRNFTEAFEGDDKKPKEASR